MAAKLKHYLLHPDGCWYRISDAAYERLWLGPVPALAGKRLRFADLLCRTRDDGAAEVVNAEFVALPYAADGHPASRWCTSRRHGADVVRSGQPWTPSENEFARLLATLSTRSRTLVDRFRAARHEPAAGGDVAEPRSRERWFAFDRDEVLYRVSAMLPHALSSLDARVPAFAGRSIPIVKAGIAYAGERPSEVVALEGYVWPFDADGRVDRRALFRLAEAAWQPTPAQQQKIEDAVFGRAFVPLLRPVV